MSDSISNQIEFIFSNSALGVGWDNPNIFNIATLSNSFSEIKKRQEIGRGLRICVNAEGQRVYDQLNVDDAERINQLTVIPNETYDTFVTQYQEEIKEVYDTSTAGAEMTHTHKDKPQNEVRFKRSGDEIINKAFKRFWKALAKKTDYTVGFNENSLIEKSIEALNKIEIADYVAEVSSRTINSITEAGIEDEFGGTENYKLKAHFSNLDLVAEMSENTGLSYNTLFKIIQRIKNYDHFVKNPPQYIHQSSVVIKNIELEEMLRGLDYHLTDESFPFEFEDYVKNIDDKNYINTLQKGVFDKMMIDSTIEKHFAMATDSDDEVICFLKLPAYYKIPTPIGEYNPDFGIVMKRKSLRNGKESEFYFVIETKGTNDINDKKSLKESEAYKAGYKKISDITIERNKRVIEKIIKEKKEATPDLFKKEERKKEHTKGLGFKVFKLQKSNFPRVEFAQDPEKTETGNIELLKKYIQEKEAQLVSLFNKNELITEILIKNGFKLNYTLTEQEAFKENEILLASDGDKETLICLDVILNDVTVEYFKTNTDQKLIVLERALDTTKKWNLKHSMGDKFHSF